MIDCATSKTVSVHYATGHWARKPTHLFTEKKINVYLSVQNNIWKYVFKE